MAGPSSSRRAPARPRVRCARGAVVAAVAALWVLSCAIGAIAGESEDARRHHESLRLGAADERRESAAWLGRNGTMETVPALLEALRDLDLGVRLLSENAIWQIWMRSGDPAIDGRMAIGTEYLNEHRFEEALRVFDEIVRLAPEFAEGYNKRATALYHLGEYRRSLDDIGETLRRNSSHFGALSGAGLCMMALREPARALGYFEQALAINPNLPGVEQMVEQLRRITKEQMM